MPPPKQKVIAVAKNAGETNKTKLSLVKCEVKISLGEWISPENCQIFYIDEDANFPEINFEIKTDEAGPYYWEWAISWKPSACQQAEGKKRFSAKNSKELTKKNSFTSPSKKWKCQLDETIGGTLIVKVESEKSKFIRMVTILGTNPNKEKIIQNIELHPDKQICNLARKIIFQESKFRHFYSDKEPLTSFDNGYGLAQLTNPAPTYEQIWSWKKHIYELLTNILPLHRKRAKKYLDTHGNYDNEMLDLETLAAYNGWYKGHHYWNWSNEENLWKINSQIICDPAQSNKGWISSEIKIQEITLDALRNDKTAKPLYTGRCYAEHIKNNSK